MLAGLGVKLGWRRYSTDLACWAPAVVCAALVKHDQEVVVAARALSLLLDIRKELVRRHPHPSIHIGFCFRVSDYNSVEQGSAIFGLNQRCTFRQSFRPCPCRLGELAGRGAQVGGWMAELGGIVGMGLEGLIRYVSIATF